MSGRISHTEADDNCFESNSLINDNLFSESVPLIRPQASIKDYESLDYDRCYNKPYERLLGRLAEGHSAAKLEAIKWIVTFLIGFFTGMVALFIDVVVKHLSSLKFGTVDQSIQSCGKEGCLAVSLVYLLLFNVGFTIIASTLVVIEPVAGGSGIPEIKCYLNGVKIPRVARLFSLVAKAVGVLFSVAGGLFVGKEGPMIHSGAIIGAGVPQFQSLAFRQINFKYSFFRTDRDKRDFVSGGAAAGVAAAFGAPIGGVLFSLEEGSSFWNQTLTWRTFFCSMAATFSLNFFLSGLDSKAWGYFYLPGLIDFGVFKCQSRSDDGCSLWGAADLLIFIVMGCVGGLLGGLFNFVNRRLTVYRLKHVQKKNKVVRILEAILVTMATTIIAFVAAMTLGDCRKIPDMGSGGGGDNGDDVINSTVRTYFCQPGYYNDMATLFFNPQEVAIKQLFHQPGTFGMPSLGIFFICFFFLACWTYGVAVPSGLFVPSLLCGAAYGRFVSNLLQTVFGYKSVYSGTYALIGAAAFLGGVVRMTISLTVILIESTNEISYGLPLMLVLMVAKWVGDLFNKGIYDMHIDLKEVPFLEWDTPADLARLKARDIVETRRLSVVFPHTRVSSLVRILKTTAHAAFPVVSLLGNDCENQSLSSFENHTENDDFNNGSTSSYDGQLEDMTDINFRRLNLKFEGIVLRSHIVMVLKKKAWFIEGQQDGVSAHWQTIRATPHRSSPSQEGDSRSMHQNLRTIPMRLQGPEPPTLSYEELTEEYPRYPDVCDLLDMDIQHDALVDIGQYSNRCPYTVYPESPVPQVFGLFRSMGLRHLPVVDHDGKLQGIITRHNLTHEFMEERLHRHQQQRQRQHH